MPGLRAGPRTRVVSPSGGSIFTTSAPRSPNCCAAHGPSTTVVQSRILTPANGPAITFPLPKGFHPTSTPGWGPATDRSLPFRWMLAGTPPYPFALGRHTGTTHQVVAEKEEA